MTSRLDLAGAQGGRGVGGEERVARARDEDDHAAFFQVADRLADDVRLGDVLDLDGRLHARFHADVLERGSGARCRS